MKTAFRLFVFATLLFVIVATPAHAGNQRQRARLCSNCAFGSKVQNCVKCEKWAPNNYAPPIFAIRAPLEVDRRIASNAGSGRQTTTPTQDYVVTAVLGTKRTIV